MQIADAPCILAFLLQVSFGPFTSPEKRITLVNIVDHYRLVLSAMPFVSVDTRVKALQALKDFSASDVANASPSSTAVVGARGSGDVRFNRSIQQLSWP